ncbi:hypothetical protein ACFQV4_12340 [Streptomyces thermocarboxydus]
MSRAFWGSSWGRGRFRAGARVLRRSGAGCPGHPLVGARPAGRGRPVLRWLLFAGGRRLVVRGKQHRAPVIASFGQLRGERYLLYLRPFGMDRRMAEPPRMLPAAGCAAPSRCPGTPLRTSSSASSQRWERSSRWGSPGRNCPCSVPGEAISRSTTGRRR